MKEFLTIPNLIAYSLLSLWLLYSVYTVIRAIKSYKKVNSYLLNSIPSVFTTIGIFGTFLGIFWGLLEFDTDSEKMQESISLLLNGLKTAFSTSIIGLFFSFVFGRIVGAIKNRAEKRGAINETSELKALNKIANLLTQIKEGQNSHFDALKSGQQEQFEGISALNNNLNIHNKAYEEKMKTQMGILNKIFEINENGFIRLSGYAQRILNKQKEIFQTANNVLSAANETNASIKSTANQLANQHEEFLGNYKEGTKQLVTKFDDFHEILKQSTTQAFVDAMQSLTETFNNQMNELLERLVKDNFERLNTSVNKLNTWQIENKKQVETLVKEFKSVVADFESSSKSIESITKNTELLVGAESKLQKILTALNKVMVDDKRFVNMTENLNASSDKLNKSANLLEENSSTIHKATQDLYNFRKAVEGLLAQFGQVTDINSTFWTNSRNEMNNVVNEINNASNNFNQVIEANQKQYVRWLGSTLNNLDTLMEDLINKINY